MSWLLFPSHCEQNWRPEAPGLPTPLSTAPCWTAGISSGWCWQRKDLRAWDANFSDPSNMAESFPSWFSRPDHEPWYLKRKLSQTASISLLRILFENKSNHTSTPFSCSTLRKIKELRELSKFAENLSFMTLSKGSSIRSEFDLSSLIRSFKGLMKYLKNLWCNLLWRNYCW